MAEIAAPGRLFTTEEVADLAQVSIRTIKRAIENGELARTKLGRATRISEASYADWVRRHTEKLAL